MGMGKITNTSAKYSLELNGDQQVVQIGFCACVGFVQLEVCGNADTASVVHGVEAIGLLFGGLFDFKELTARQSSGKAFHTQLVGIRLVIHSNGIDKETALTLKKYNQNLKKYHLVIKLSYSNEYIKENYLKQVIITTITYCFIIIICLSCMAISYVLINNKASEANVAKINERINTVIESSKNNTPTPSEETKEEPNDNLESPIKNKELESLLKINSDTVGWLTVPNTNIDYPVVKTTDNDYYLDHNYEKKYDYNGWVFMHYYNSTHNLDKNTIIFAHNRFYSGIMFGTLNEVTKDTWYNNTKENLITFNTLYDNMQFEVFSIYKTNITADYLKTTFDNDLEWNNFIKMIRERSMFQNNINVGTNDKIITLSTCLDNDTRLVVHAVLRKI